MKNQLDAYACAEKLRELEARLEALEQRVDAYHLPGNLPGKEAHQITLYTFDVDGSVVKEEVDIVAFLGSYSVQGMEVMIDSPLLSKEQMDQLQRDGISVLTDGIPYRSSESTLLKY